MDILAHGLWTNAVYRLVAHKKKKALRAHEKLIAIFFGIMPDLIAFGPAILINIFKRSTDFISYAETRFMNEWGVLIPNRAIRYLSHASSSPANPASVPTYVYDLYNFSHSFAIFLFAFGIVWLLRKKPYWLMAGWGFHIFIDVWSHTSRFFPTPVFYPFSNSYFSGISWADPTFVVVNYGLLILIYVYLHESFQESLRKRKNKIQ